MYGTRLKSLRSFSRHFHLWSGLSLGLLLAVLGITGAALVFYIEIDAALHPAVQSTQSGVAADWDAAVWDEVLATARREFADPQGDWSFEINGSGGPIPARFYPSQQHHGHHAERVMVWFSADGQQVVRAEPWGQYLMSWLYELHMHLLAAEPGRLVVGWGGLATLLLLVSGIINWWPRGSWRNALSFKRKALAIRRLRDLHKHGGIWGLLLLVLLVFTGALLALPEVKTQVLTALVAAPDELPQPRSAQTAATRIPLTQALTTAHNALPDAQLAFVDVPGDATAPYRMRVQVPGDPHRRFPGSYVFVDQYSGQVLAVHDIRQGNAATRIAAWIRAIHDGSIGGICTRMLAIIIGLLPAALFVTGYLYWQQRRTRRQQRTHSLHPGPVRA